MEVCDLDVHVTPEGYAWGLWQWVGHTEVPIFFWSQLWKEQGNLIIEQQVNTVYQLLATETITRLAKVQVHTT